MPEESARLQHRASIAQRYAQAERIAVFCDFDGTFSVQDVGSTLARRFLGEQRADLWSRYEAGEIDAWQYNMELLDGFVFPEADLQEFLATIDLDPGARALMDWCEKKDAEFRILSDGFDYNLDHLQEINGVHFDYAANSLRYEGDVWRIAPGARNPGCSCGTGTCKKGIIAARKSEAPAAICIHVGNGRVSDLCGALVADLAFAKDTLSDALEAQGRPYEPFATLHDVVAGLDALEQEAGRKSA